jgi:hypothetical protein
MKTISSIISVFLTLNQFVFSQDVVINEIVSLNNTIIMDDFGEESDWIELYNKSDDSINLTSWHLSDDENEISKWMLPDTTLAPHGFILIFCSGRDTLSAYLHSNFKLKSSGEPIILSDSNGNVIDQYPAVKIGPDISYGRKTDGISEIDFFYKTSPGQSNSNNLLLNNISFSHPDGFYETNIYLSLFSQDTVGKIYYTINGNDPEPGTSYTCIFNEPLSMIDLQSLPAQYSYIPTTPLDLVGCFLWQEPLGEVEKCVVVKARVFKEEQPLCNTYSGTYFIGNDINQRFSLPVLSIIMDSISLFSEDTGIYVPGKRYIPGEIKTGNYFESGAAWERKASFTYFSSSGELLHKQEIGIQIQGNITRAAPNKSLEYTARECYDGSEDLNFPFFDVYSNTDYKKVITRSIFAAHNQSIVRDEIMQEIAKNLNVSYQEWKPVITFINGEYWGFQVMREKQDKFYLHQHYDVNPDSVDIIEAWGVVIEGDLVQHDSLNYFVCTHDLSIQENYERIKEMIDIPAYIDYYITEIFVANQDWPGNNFTKWRQRGANFKWYYFLFDLDNGGVCLNLNNLKRATGDTIDEIMPYWSTHMFKAILSNEEFRSDFINRFVEVLNNDFNSENTVAVVDKWESIVENEAGNTINRWRINESMDAWHQRMDQLKEFFLLRPCIVKNQLEEYFGIDSLNINCGNSQVHDKTLQKIKVFPNPSNSKCYINSEDDIQSWVFYSLTGLPVMEKNRCNIKTEEINISQLQAGIYFIVINVGDIKHRFKIVKIN